MSCLGVHFALTDKEAEHLIQMDDEAQRLEYIVETIEEAYVGTEYAAESDKAWDAMHRALSDGYLNWEGGKYPLNHTILAGTLLYSSDDYIMSLKTPMQVRDVASKVSGIDKSHLRSLYNSIPANDYDAELDEEDFEYTWEWFQGVVSLYILAAQEGKYVLFTADQ